MATHQHADDIERMVDRVELLDEAQLFSGLSVLMTDASQYLTTHAEDVSPEQRATFQSLYGDGLTEQVHWGWDSPLARMQWEVDVWDEVNLVTGLTPGEIAERTAEGTFDIGQLDDQRLVHEWFLFPGQNFFEQFQVKFREVICGPGGPYEQFEGGLIGQEQLPAVIATAILTAGFSGGSVFVPLSVYVGLLLVKTGLKAYCEVPEMDE